MKPIPFVASMLLSVAASAPAFAGRTGVCALLAGPATMPADAGFDLKLNGLSADEALRFLLAETGLELVTDDSLQVPLAGNFEGMSIPGALELVSRRQDLDWNVEGNALVLSRTRSETFHVHYLGNPEAPFWRELQNSLTSLVGDRARLVFAPRAGTVTVFGPPSAVSAAQAYLEDLESVLERQVNIEARIVELALHDDFEMGVDWTALEHGWNNVEGNTDNGGLLQLETVTRAGAFQLGLIRTDRLELLIDLLEERGNLRILSQPRVAAMGNEPAFFRMTENVPFYEIQVLTGTGGEPYVQYTVNFKEAGVVLEVMANIGVDGLITLNVHPTVSSLTGFTESLPNLPPQPIIDSRETSTSVRLREDQTVVIGGMIRTLEERSERGVPILSRIPLLGALFRRTATTESRRELVVLLTPAVLRDALLTALREDVHMIPIDSGWVPRSAREGLAANEHARALEAFASADAAECLRRQERAVRLAPDAAAVRLNLGIYQAFSGRISDARQTLLRLQGRGDAIGSWATVALDAMALALETNGWVPPEPADAASNDAPDARAAAVASLLNEASWLSRQGRTDEARQTLSAARVAAENTPAFDELFRTWDREIARPTPSPRPSPWAASEALGTELGK